MTKIRVKLIFFSSFIIGITCYSQAPNLISYQTVIRNANNELVSNTTIGVRISILGGSDANVLVYQEEHTVKTNINGLAYLTIGNGTILNGLISSIDWSKGPYFVKSETDPTGGKNYSIVVLSQMLSVPYAIYSSTAEKLLGTVPEIDPLFNGSLAKGITASDTSYWNRKLNASDTSRMLSNYRISINNKLDAKDTTKMLSNYLKKSESLNEIDPIFSLSIAKGITTKDTSYWNKKLNTTDTSRMLENYLKKESFPQNPKNGDILFYYSNKWVNLEKGKNGQVLTLIDDLPKWSGTAYPSITTNIISNITSTSANSGGNISSDGGASVSARGLVYSTSPNPTLSNSVLTIGSGTGSFSGTITGLASNSTYYVKAYATNSIGTAYGNQESFTTSSASQTVTDFDGNTYNTIKIGTQIWMSENLRTTKYRNGETIVTGLNDGAWFTTKVGAYSIYNNDVANDAIYGKLYNWFAVNDPRGICPTGWHVPTDNEWNILTEYLSGFSVAGGKMKVTGTTYWNSPNTAATNESGFSALPGGSRSTEGGFSSIKSFGMFYSGTEQANAPDHAWFWSVGSTDGSINRYNANKNAGLSVRCLKN